ncbi:MAG: DUF4160 domain-containing protein [Nitrospirota bacterium]
MPTVRGIEGPYRFFFYSFDCNEPKHIHAQRDRHICKFWLEPISLAGNDGFAPHELNRIRKILLDQRVKMIEAWEEHCGHE